MQTHSNQLPPLTAEQTRLVLDNQRFVWKLAGNFACARLGSKPDSRQHGELTEELAGYGMVGLVIAARRYDPAKINPQSGQPYKFCTYAGWWIRNQIQEGLKQAHPVGPSFASRDGFDKSGHEWYRHNIEIRPDDSGTFDVLGKEDQEQERRWPLHVWATIQRKLGARDYKILRLRFRFGWVLQDIADEIGVSKERVRQVLDETLVKLHLDKWVKELAA